MNIKAGLVIMGFAACCGSSGCAPRHSITVAGPAGVSAETELVIYEVVIRNAVANEAKGDTLLVSFGRSWIDHVDPPAGFLGRLDVDVSLKPVSQRDQLSHRNAVLLEVRLVEPRSETEAKVSVTRFRFGVGASDGFTARVEWADGVWKIAKTTDHWGT
jgi:hypothetical protein